jgi:hypothetical protein
VLGARVDPNLTRKSLLGDPKRLLVVHQSFGQVVSDWERVESKETDDSRHVAYTRLSVSLLPIDERQGGAADCPCHLLLQELKVEAALPNGLSNVFRDGRIARMLPKVWTLLATQLPQYQVAKRQRIPVVSDIAAD